MSVYKKGHLMYPVFYIGAWRHHHPVSTMTVDSQSFDRRLLIKHWHSIICCTVYYCTVWLVTTHQTGIGMRDCFVMHSHFRVIYLRAIDYVSKIVLKGLARLSSCLACRPHKGTWWKFGFNMMVHDFVWTTSTDSPFCLVSFGDATSLNENGCWF